MFDQLSLTGTIGYRLATQPKNEAGQLKARQFGPVQSILMAQNDKKDLHVVKELLPPQGPRAF